MKLVAKPKTFEPDFSKPLGSIVLVIAKLTISNIIQSVIPNAAVQG